MPRSSSDKTDTVTQQWRGWSLRAKVTAVAVSVLVFGLTMAGVGTAPLLYNVLVAGVDSSVIQLNQADFSKVAVPQADDGSTPSAPTPTPIGLGNFVAIYDQDGDFVAMSGDSAQSAPELPPNLPLASAITHENAPFTLPSEDNKAEFRATVAVHTTADGTLFTQLVAAPLTPAQRSVASFVGIYSIIAIIAVLLGALLTNWLVTLAFRSLRQVEATALSIASGDFSQRMSDIAPGTEVGSLKAALNTMLARVDQAISERDRSVSQMRQFVGNASHELRTPLVSLRGYAELYRMGAISDDEDVARAMDRIEKEAIRMSSLVEDLLELARLDEHKALPHTAVDLRLVAADAALDLQAAAPDRTVTVIDTCDEWQPTTSPKAESAASRTEVAHPKSKRVPRTGPRRGFIGLLGNRAEASPTPLAEDDATAAEPEVIEYPRAPIAWGNENQIRQVVTNLLGNARRFSPSGSPIEIGIGLSSNDNEHSAWIAIVDHGEGIPEQLRQKIFERFWRADTSRTRETGGSGLGLAIVASLVEQLSAKILVSETPGGGATFRVNFPLAPSSAQPEQ